MFRGKSYLACTPYPYGKDAYENPCVYVWSPEEAKWDPVEGAFPVVTPERVGHEHYSDPCLFSRGDLLTLLFRRCIFHKTGKRDYLYEIHTVDGINWSKPALVIEEQGDRLISPAVASEGDAVFCVEYTAEEERTDLVRYELAEPVAFGEKTACKILGLGTERYIWHIDVKRQRDGRIWGLFMLRSKGGSESDYGLALFLLREDGHTWEWIQDVPLSGSERREIWFIYKSAFSDKEDTILCSARDKNANFFLFEKPLPVDWCQRIGGEKRNSAER